MLDPSSPLNFFFADHKVIHLKQILVAFLLHIKSALIFRFYKKQHFEYDYHTISLTKQLTSWLPEKREISDMFLLPLATGQQ